MPITVRHNKDLELNRVDYAGQVTLAELLGMVEFVTVEPAWITFDCLNLVHPGGEFAGIALSDLDKVFGRYKQIFAPLDLLILRRAAWICESPLALRHIRYWLENRDTKQHMLSDIRLFETYDAAGDWLLLRARELDMLKRGEGFTEVVRFDAPLAAMTR